VPQFRGSLVVVPSFQVPAVCSSCGRAFPISLRDSTPQDGASSRRSVDLCPFCGGIGEIADGVYDVAVRGWAIVRSVPATREELIGVAWVVRRAIMNDAQDLLDVQRQVQNRAPVLAELVAALENSTLTSTRSTLELLLSIITAALDKRIADEPRDPGG
jgi:hypothetical protein